MWPFTSRRIFGNRWWAVAFVVFICWQAAEFAGDKTVANSGNAEADAEYARDMANSLNSF